MGLGKTISALATIKRLIRMRKIKQALIVVPASLVDGWLKECEAYLGVKPYAYRGTKRDACQIRKHRIVVISYELLRNDFSVVSSGLKDEYALVLDEVHYIKNDDSLRTRTAKKLRPVRRYGLSGTLIWDTPDDLWSLLHWLHPNIAGTKEDWERKYCRKALCRIRARGGGYRYIEKVVAYRNLPDMHALLDRFTLRRTKEECLDIPPKSVHYIAYTLDNKTRSLWDICKPEWQDVNVSKALIRLSQLLSGVIKRGNGDECKVSFFESAKLVYLRDMMNCRSGQMIVWFRFRETLWQIVENIPEKVYVIDGSVSMAERQKVLAAWSKSKDGVLFATIRAAGTGTNMQSCSTAVFYEMEYVPALNNQAEDRIYRIGQKKKTTIYYLYAPGTVEEAILDLTRAKKKLNNVVVTGKFKKKMLEEIYAKVYTLFGSNDPTARREKYHYYMGE